MKIKGGTPPSTRLKHAAQWGMVRVAVVFALVIVIAVLLGGCTRTVTITAKYRAFYGWWYVCTGAQPFPCSKYHVYRVTQQEYDQARVGQSYTVRLP